MRLFERKNVRNIRICVYNLNRNKRKNALKKKRKRNCARLNRLGIEKGTWQLFYKHMYDLSYYDIIYVYEYYSII